MDLLSLALAEESLASATALVPSAVPSSWTGPAASACQQRLDTLRLLLAGLPARLEEARTTTAVLDNPLLQCVVP